jgi:hypothetical protein
MAFISKSVENPVAHILSLCLIDILITQGGKYQCCFLPPELDFLSRVRDGNVKWIAKDLGFVISSLLWLCQEDLHQSLSKVHLVLVA